MDPCCTWSQRRIFDADPFRESSQNHAREILEVQATWDGGGDGDLHRRIQDSTIGAVRKATGAYE